MDSRGRLFGGINIIDFTVILLLISFVSALCVGYKLSLRHSETAIRPVSIQVRFLEVMPELINVVKPGNVETDPLGNIIGSITGILEASPSEVVVLRGDNQLAMKISNVKKDLLIKMDIICKEKKTTFFYKDQPVKIGEDFVFSTNLYTLRGIVTDIKDERIR
ncbi:MAG: DUF4330 domain-containing protein [Candidatus Omnitrophota bacterium]|nr:DUF4330 domain-containing protein [Candidatus Omnitrophota bacterium]